MNKEVKERLKSIISVLLFLGIATWYWYGPREDVTYLATNMNKYYFQSKIKIMSDEKELKLNNQNYKFKVVNQTDELQNYEIIVNNNYIKLRKNNCSSLQNNYVKYQLYTKEKDVKEQNLNSDGIIYRGVLQPNESLDFSIRLKTDKNDLRKDECFYPILNATTYYKI